jgi:A/G-specific adenine glycosylase
VADGFPREYQAIRALPGIGDYTAAAIASIAFDLPHAVVDGNVMRVVARIQADSGDIASARTRERFRAIAQAWLDRKQPGAFNQALMELGATVCLPKNPLCLLCPLSTCCLARQQGITAQLPVKLRKTEPVQIAAVLLLVHKGGRVLLRRTEAGSRRMAGFWELPSPEQLPGARIGKSIGEFRHTITHHHYTFTVRAAVGRAAGAEFKWFAPAQLAEVPLSTTARKALQLARNQ